MTEAEQEGEAEVHALLREAVVTEAEQEGDAEVHALLREAMVTEAEQEVGEALVYAVPAADSGAVMAVGMTAKTGEVAAVASARGVAAVLPAEGVMGVVTAVGIAAVSAVAVMIVETVVPLTARMVVLL